MTLVSRPTTIHDLPEELLTEILGHSLIIPLETFFEQEFDKHMRSARYRREELGLAPDYVILLVCKQWWRLSEPLLYSSVLLVSMLDMQSITSFLERKPFIGPKVRHVRLHGGFGRALVEFAERASNVEAVYLSSQEVWDSIEVVGALERALYTFSPSVLYIGFMNKSFGSMLDSYSALMSFVQYSDSLKFVHFAKFVYFTESLENALVSSPSIEIISFHSNLLNMIGMSGNLLERLAEEGRVRRIICRDSEHCRSRFEERYSKSVLQLLCFA